MRWFAGILLALLAGAGIYVGSALVSLSGLAEAARAGDGAGVIARTDVERLRRSLVDQIVLAYLKQLGKDRPVKPLERVLATTYGATVADAIIAKMLTEENLTRILKDGGIELGRQPDCKHAGARRDRYFQYAGNVEAYLAGKAGRIAGAPWRRRERRSREHPFRRQRMETVRHSAPGRGRPGTGSKPDRQQGTQRLSHPLQSSNLVHPVPEWRS